MPSDGAVTLADVRAPRRPRLSNCLSEGQNRTLPLRLRDQMGIFPI
jgi:hypothetical protein